MKQQLQLRVSREMPLERIFRKIMHRKMTALERTCFNLKPEVAVKVNPRKLI